MDVKEFGKVFYKKRENIVILISIALLLIIDNSKYFILLDAKYNGLNKFLGSFFWICIIVQKIKLIKNIYKDIIDVNYENTFYIKRAFINNITSNIAIGIQMLPLLVLYIIVVVLKVDSGIFFSNTQIGLISTIVSLPYLYIFCFSIIIASVEEMGWFKNTIESYRFIKANNDKVYKIIIIYLLPQMLLSFTNALFNISYLSYLIYQSIGDIISLLVFPFICFLYFSIKFKDSKLVLNHNLKI